MSETRPGVVRGIVSRVAQVLLFYAIWAAAFFVAAGTLRWPRAWICLALYVILFAVSGSIVIPRRPSLAAERSRMGRGTKTFDKIFIALCIPTWLSMPAVAGLDAVRFGWSALPLWTVPVGASLLVAGMVPAIWAMISNPHLETTVRIQEERGHTVATVGPYGIVRHPMYVGMILMLAAEPLVLGSAWALVPAGACIALFVWRTAMEDATLRRELGGYDEYARRTRFRLLPGVW